MRYSRSWLALKYANRSRYLTSAVLCFLVAFMFSPILCIFGTSELPLTLAGRTADAVVKDKAVERGGKSPSYVLRYSFQADGQKFDGRTAASKQEWEQSQGGQPLTVVYLPSDPRVSRAGGGWGIALVFPLIGFVALLRGLWLVARGVIDVLGKARLTSSGEATLAVIDRLDVVTHRRGSSIARLGYAYRAGGDGGTAHHTTLTDNIPFSVGEVRLGDVVVVLYARDDPSRSVVDYFDARRDDRLRLMADPSRSPSPRPSELGEA